MRKLTKAEEKIYMARVEGYQAAIMLKYNGVYSDATWEACNFEAHSAVERLFYYDKRWQADE